MKKTILFVLLASVTLCFTWSCAPTNKATNETTDEQTEVTNDGRFSTRTYTLGDFTNIQVDNVVKVIYTQGDDYKVQLMGRTDWLDLMEVTSVGGLLKVHATSTKKFQNVKSKDQPDGEHNFILYLTAPCLQNINLSGVSCFESQRLASDWLSVRLEGVSKFNVDAIECASLHLGLGGVSKVNAGSFTCQKFEADIEGSSKAEIQHIKAQEVGFSINGASKVNLPDVSQGEKATFNVGGASKLTLTADVSELLQIGLSGASKGELTYKGGNLRSFCTGVSKLNAEVNCKDINASCDGASKTSFSGTADKVEIDRNGVAANINTSRLNQH